MTPREALRRLVLGLVVAAEAVDIVDDLDVDRVRFLQTATLTELIAALDSPDHRDAAVTLASALA